MSENPNFDLLITFIHAHFHGPVDTSAEEFLKEYRIHELSKPLLAVMEERPHNDDSQAAVQKLMEEVKERLAAAGIPYFPGIEQAAEAASKLIDYYQRRESR